MFAHTYKYNTLPSILCGFCLLLDSISELDAVYTFAVSLVSWRHAFYVGEVLHKSSCNPAESVTHSLLIHYLTS